MRFFSLLAHILFPASCLCCQKRTANHSLCDACRDHLSLHIHHTCPHCQKRQTSKGQVCMKCFDISPLDGVFSVLSYQDPIVKECIYAFKYSFVQTLAKPFGIRMARRLQHEDIPLCNIIIPIPLHSLRFRWRGFNQAQLLAESLAQHLLSFHTLPLRTDLLIRKRFTKTQAKIFSKKEREKNLHNAFSFKGDPLTIKEKTIWLIDDISTTNSTLTECARILKKNGAKEVWGITLAR
jgi:ComF family protein